jgi:hypothetical protein
VVLKARDTMGGFPATVACMVSVLHFRFVRERERERERKASIHLHFLPPSRVSKSYAACILLTLVVPFY